MIILAKNLELSQPKLPVILHEKKNKLYILHS